MNNFIIHEHAREYQWSGDCFLSIKSFDHGEAIYSVGHREYLVDRQSFLILNECTRYNICIDNDHLTESFCVFFSPQFVSRIVGELSLTDAKLLDLKTDMDDGIHFLERKYKQSGVVSKLLLDARRKKINLKSTLEKEEFYHDLLCAIIDLNMEAHLEADKLALKKKSTRVEIYERVQHARDFMECHFTQNLSLAEIASHALLSENHLLRCFKQIFGMSPFKYISNLRIREARRQIAETDKPISEIAMAVGYSSLSNFSHYYKLVTGVSPRQDKLGDI